MAAPLNAFTDPRTFQVAVVDGVAQHLVVTLPAGIRTAAIVARVPRAATRS
jgi:hypothetical protein